MRYKITDKKIQAIIDELGEEYKDLLYEHVLEDTNQVHTDDINLVDLMRIDLQVKSRIRNNRSIQRQNYVLSLISIMGVLYAFLGFTILMLSELEKKIIDNPTIMIAVVLILIGLFSALSALMFKTYSSIRPSYYRKKQQSISPYEIIDKWKTIEALINELTPEEITPSLFEMIHHLYEGNIITSQDLDVINVLRKARNNIVHSSKGQEYTQAELRHILDSAEKTIHRLEKFV